MTRVIFEEKMLDWVIQKRVVTFEKDIHDFQREQFIEECRVSLCKACVFRV